MLRRSGEDRIDEKRRRKKQAEERPSVRHPAHPRLLSRVLPLLGEAIGGGVRMWVVDN